MSTRKTRICFKGVVKIFEIPGDRLRFNVLIDHVDSTNSFDSQPKSELSLPNVFRRSVKERRKRETVTMPE
jgi:hypothetical protein